MKGAATGVVVGTFENVTVNGIAPLHAGTLPFEIAHEEEQVMPRIELFPNPAASVLNVRLLEFIGQSASLSIINTNGQVVRSRQFEKVYDELLQLDINDLDNGLYILRVEGQAQVVKQKFLIIQD